MSLLRSLLRSLLVALLAALSLSGCGVRYVYSQLDWIVPWYLRDYVTLDREQRSLLDVRLGERLDWHCRSQLPEYALWLREAESSVLAGHPDRATLERMAARAESFGYELMVAVSGDVASLLATLDDGQVQRLAIRFDEQNRKTREEFVDAPDDVLEARRVERIEKRLRRWIGSLNDTQRLQLESWSAELEPIAEEWLANRIAWQQSLIAALAHRADGRAFEIRIAEWILRPDTAWSADYRARLERNRVLTMERMVELLGSLTARQERRLLGEIASLASQFERMACVEPGSLGAQASR